MKRILKRIVLGLVLLTVCATPLGAVDLEPLRGVYDPCEMCAMGFWVHCWSCAMIMSWESGEPWGWWE